MTDETKTALLSKLRAPVAPAPDGFVPVAASVLRTLAEPGLIKRTLGKFSPALAAKLGFTPEEEKAIEAMYLAFGESFDYPCAPLASAPVAGEADQDEMERRGWVNIGYKHDLEKARRAISHCNIPGFDTMSLDNAIYWLRARADDAAHQAIPAGEAQPVAYAVHNIDTKGDVRVAAVKPWAGPESMRDADRWGNRWAGNRPLVYGDAAPQASEAVRDAEDAERWRWATASDGNADKLCSIVLCHGGYQEKINDRADFYRAALSAQPGAQKKGGSDAN